MPKGVEGILQRGKMTLHILKERIEKLCDDPEMREVLKRIVAVESSVRNPNVPNLYDRNTGWTAKSVGGHVGVLLKSHIVYEVMPGYHILNTQWISLDDLREVIGERDRREDIEGVICRVNGYTLCEKMPPQGGYAMRFFTKDPRGKKEIPLPDGYEVMKTKSGLPVLKKIIKHLNDMEEKDE